MKVLKRYFIFNTRGKINKKESKELQRTHKNIFDWVQKETKKVEEKDCFERKEEIEMRIEPMEVDVMDRQERLDRVKRRAATWETSRICQELTLEMVEGVGRASSAIMMESLVAEMVERAGVAGHLNNIILEIVNYGQEVRDRVGRRLRNERLKEELSMKMMLAEMDREERLQEKAKKKAARLDRYYKKESAETTTMMGMLTASQGRDIGRGWGHHHD